MNWIKTSNSRLMLPKTARTEVSGSARRLEAGIVKSKKTAIASQRLVETRFPYSGKLKQVFMATANNKEMNFFTWYSVAGSCEASLGETTESRDKSQEREREREYQRIED
jgi:hypothetical protein